MNRTILAFTVAPLWVPLLLIPFARLVLFPDPGGGIWVAMTAFLSFAFSYGGTFLIGAPVFAFLRSRNLTAPWIAVVLGFAIGATVYFVFNVLFGLALGNSAHDILRTTQSVFTAESLWGIVFIGGPGSIGALVGFTLWVIARPDRD